MTKNKPAIIAKKIKQLEAGASNLPLPRRGKEKDEKIFKRTVAGLVLVGILIAVSIASYFMTQATQADLDDKKRFVQLKEIVGKATIELNRLSPRSVVWGQPEAQCTSMPPQNVGDSNVWMCKVGPSGSISFDKTVEVENIIYDMRDKLKSLTDLDYKYADSTKGFPDSMSLGGSYQANFRIKSLNIPCSLSFVWPDKESSLYDEGKVSSEFSCSDNARKAWYEPTGNSVDADGANAWKE